MEEALASYIPLPFAIGSSVLPHLPSPCRAVAIAQTLHHRWTLCAVEQSETTLRRHRENLDRQTDCTFLHSHQ